MSDKQVGGTHYQKSDYDPIWLVDKFNLTFIQGNVIKYCFRAALKNGLEDLRKALSYCDIAVDYHEREIDKQRENKLTCEKILTLDDFCRENSLNEKFFKLVTMVYMGNYYTAKEIINKSIESKDPGYFTL